MSETQRWTHEDKSTWANGVWQNEPDKVQWVDEDSGLDCLAVRNHYGAWCGYVGVPAGHPLHGKSHDDCPDFDVHGGLTFSDGCHEPTRQQYDKHCSMYPGQPVKSFEEWSKGEMASRICHVARPDVGEVWWLGFDCAHGFDLCPKPSRATNVSREISDAFDGLNGGSQYRTLGYVSAEIGLLAKQVMLAGQSPGKEE